eukprot:1051413-Alexandrium_andersonii.AAC.1
MRSTRSPGRVFTRPGRLRIQRATSLSGGGAPHCSAPPGSRPRSFIGECGPLDSVLAFLPTQRPRSVADVSKLPGPSERRLGLQALGPFKAS